MQGVGDAIGVSKETIRLIESRYRIPAHDVLLRLCEVLALDPKEALFFLHREQFAQREAERNAK